MYEFRWNEWNIEHIGTHGVAPREAEYILNHARAPYPQRLGDNKFLAVGRTGEGKYLQVVYIFDPPETVFVIHARLLREQEKRRFRRRRR